MRNRRVPGFVLAALASFAIGTAPAGAGQVERADSRLDRALDELVQMKGGPPGAAAIVDRGNGPRLHRSGTADLADGRPYRKRDHLRIASVSKAFSGAVALTLVDRGALSLDDTVGELLPELPAAWSEVTLRQALSHTGGLPDYIADEEFRQTFAANPRRYFAPQELIGYVADEPLVYAPGARYEYSDTDNIVVALMAEAAGRAAYEALLSRLVYGQLGLRDTSLPDTYLLPRPYVHGYDLSGDAPEDVSELINASGPWASGGIVSSPVDLNGFVRGYGGGALFGGSVRAQQFQFIPGGESEPPGPGENSAGLGIFRYETRCGTLVGHTGNIPGYTTLIATAPGGRRSVVVTVNAQISPETAARQFRRLREAQELAACAALAGRAN